MSNHILIDDELPMILWHQVRHRLNTLSIIAESDSARLAIARAAFFELLTNDAENIVEIVPVETVETASAQPIVRVTEQFKRVFVEAANDGTIFEQFKAGLDSCKSGRVQSFGQSVHSDYLKTVN